jgi:hypothetical protein
LVNISVVGACEIYFARMIPIHNIDIVILSSSDREMLDMMSAIDQVV